MLSQCWGHHLSLYNLLVRLPMDRKSLKTKGKNWQGPSSKKMYKRADKVGQIWDGAVAQHPTAGTLTSHFSRERSQLGFFFFLQPTKIVQCSFLHVFYPCFLSPKTSVNAFQRLQRRLDFCLQGSFPLPPLPSSGCSCCCWIATLLLVPKRRHCYGSWVKWAGFLPPTPLFFFLTPFNSLTVLTPRLSAVSLHDEPWHRWI